MRRRVHDRPSEGGGLRALRAAWIALVNTRGGTHHGYFLPSEGASDRALALFSFESLAARALPAALRVDADFIAADRIRDESGCVLRYERTFMRPGLEGQLPDR